MNQVSIIKILNTDEVKLQVRVRIDGIGQLLEPKLGQARIQAFCLNPQRYVI